MIIINHYHHKAEKRQNSLLNKPIDKWGNIACVNGGNGYELRIQVENTTIKFYLSSHTRSAR